VPRDDAEALRNLRLVICGAKKTIITKAIKMPSRKTISFFKHLPILGAERCSALLLFLAICPSALCQSWSGILNSTRAENWQRANVGVTGGIPSASYIQCGSTVPSTASASTINSDITACGANTYLLLGPGTFSLSAGIIIHGKSNFALRGSGPTQTTLAFTAGTPCFSGNQDICVNNSSELWDGGQTSAVAQVQSGGSNWANWTGGFSQSATSITVANVGSTGIVNGQELILDQQSDLNDNGGSIVCDSNGGNGPNASGSTVCMANTVTNGNVGRTVGGSGGFSYSQQQRVIVTAGCSTTCTGAGPFTLTIAPGLYANNWGNHGANTTAAWWVFPSEYVGIENMTIDHTNTTSTAGNAFWNCSNCWVKNIRDIKVNNEHVLIYNSSRDEVRDSYFFETKNFASQSYGILLFPASDCLIENNIFQQISGPILAGGEGNVFGYNYWIDDVVASPTYGQGTYPSHDAGNLFELWEGNIGNSLIMDQLHGTSGLDTIFRNWLVGRDWNTCTYSSGTCTNANNYGHSPTVQTYPIDFDSYNRGLNVIANVLGTPGYHSNYQAITPNSYTGTQCNQSIYEMGWGGAPCANQQGVLGDTVVTTSLMRWGNYDVVNAAVRWDSTESSPGAVQWIDAQSTPASETLPPSFYLGSIPSFFYTPQGTFAFPLIGPDVATGTGGFFATGIYAGGACPVGTVSGGATCATAVGGHASVNAAMNCYFNVMAGPADGSGNVLSFDAANCYGSTPLAAPTNLVAMPH